MRFIIYNILFCVLFVNSLTLLCAKIATLLKESIKILSISTKNHQEKEESTMALLFWKFSGLFIVVVAGAAGKFVHPGKALQLVVIL